jgi:hypothetical protein
MNSFKGGLPRGPNVHGGIVVQQFLDNIARKSKLESDLYLEGRLDLLAEPCLLPVFHDKNSSIDLPHAQAATPDF